MDTYRAFVAIIISFVILLGYQYLFVGFGNKSQAPVEQTKEQPASFLPTRRPIPPLL